MFEILEHLLLLQSNCVISLLVWFNLWMKNGASDQLQHQKPVDLDLHYFSVEEMGGGGTNKA